jgi:hypothetical protein
MANSPMGLLQALSQQSTGGDEGRRFYAPAPTIGNINWPLWAMYPEVMWGGNARPWAMYPELMWGNNAQ